MGAVKKVIKKVTGGVSSAPAPAPAPAITTVSDTTPSSDGNVVASDYVKAKGKRSLLTAGKGGASAYRQAGGDQSFAVFLEELMKRKTLG